MAAKSKSKKKAKAKAAAHQKTVATTPVSTENKPVKPAAPKSPGKHPKQIQTEAELPEQTIELGSTISAAAKLPTGQRLAIGSCLLLLAAVSFYVLIAGIANRPMQVPAKQIPPSSTPGGIAPITNTLNAPITQQTNPTQAAPSINSGSSSNSVQSGTGSRLQEQSPSLQ